MQISCQLIIVIIFCLIIIKNFEPLGLGEEIMRALENFIENLHILLYAIINKSW